jgi:hypothetical protein
MSELIQMNKLILLSVWVDNPDEQTNPDIRRRRFIARTADLSALSGYSAIQIICETPLSATRGGSAIQIYLLNIVIGPRWVFNTRM